MDPGEKGAIMEAGGPARQEGEKAGSWLQTAEKKRHSKMAKEAGGRARHIFKRQLCTE